MSRSWSDLGDELNILFFTQYYPPEVGAAPTRAVHFARALMRAGHRVTVVTGLPNHPSGEKQPQFRPGTSVDDDGITVRRTWLYASPKKTALSRFWNHLSFAISGDSVHLFRLYSITAPVEKRFLAAV